MIRKSEGRTRSDPALRGSAADLIAGMGSGIVRPSPRTAASPRQSPVVYPAGHRPDPRTRWNNGTEEAPLNPFSEGLLPGNCPAPNSSHHRPDADSAHSDMFALFHDDRRSQPALPPGFLPILLVCCPDPLLRNRSLWHLDLRCSAIGAASLGFAPGVRPRCKHLPGWFGDWPVPALFALGAFAASCSKVMSRKGMSMEEARHLVHQKAPSWAKAYLFHAGGAASMMAIEWRHSTEDPSNDLLGGAGIAGGLLGGIHDPVRRPGVRDDLHRAWDRRNADPVPETNHLDPGIAIGIACLIPLYVLNALRGEAHGVQFRGPRIRGVHHRQGIHPDPRAGRGIRANSFVISAVWLLPSSPAIQFITWIFTVV